MFENLNNIVGDPKLKAEFKNTLAELPKIFQEVRVTIADTRQAIQKYGTIPDSVKHTLRQVDGTLDRVDKTAGNIGVAAENIGEFAGTLNESSPEILGKIKSSLSSVDKFLSDAKKITKQFENFDESDSTIAKLLSDDEIYDSILRTTRNVEEVSGRSQCSFGAVDGRHSFVRRCIGTRSRSARNTRGDRSPTRENRLQRQCRPRRLAGDSQARIV